MAQSIESRKWPDLSRVLVVLGWLGMLIFAFHSCTHMVAAGDTWVAMACGRHFVNHGVDTIEPFSANSHEAGPTEHEVKTWPKWAQWITDKVGLDTVKYWHPTGWVNQNWLTHVIFYKLSTTMGSEQDPYYNALVFWKFAIYIIAVVCVYYIGRLLGAGQVLAAVFACFAMFVGRSFLDVRPAGFSNLLVAVYILVLVLATYRNSLYIWLLVPVIVFWCNVHGGYIYAFIMMVPFIGLHLFILLPRRWTISLYSIGLYFVLYALTYKFLSYEHLSGIRPHSPALFSMIVVLAAASVILAAFKRLGNELFYGYHILAGVLVFICLLARFFPAIAPNLTQTGRRFVTEYIRDSQLSFVVVFGVLTTLGVVLSFFKTRLISIGPKGLVHTIAAGGVSFIAMVLFNPFHLTNLTHTFVVSLSKHAERWRDVNEWHPAFEWSNPVGTSFPFVIIIVLGIGVVLLWFWARRLSPQLYKGPKNQQQLHRSRSELLMKLFGTAAAIYACWVVFISCSFLNLSAGDLLISALFVGILLLSIFKSIHFIYLVIPLVLVALQMAAGSKGYLGRYIYPFVLVPGYVISSILASRFSNKVKTRPADIGFVLLAAVICLVLMTLLIDPLKLKSDWSFDRLLSLRRLWRPSYEYSGGGALGYRHLFGVLYALNIAAVIVAVAMPYVRNLFKAVPEGPDPCSQKQDYQLPKIDLVIIVIAALTIYMAIRSRRFIPVAGVVACPVLAALISEMFRTISAAKNHHNRNRFAVSPTPYRLQVALVVAGIAAVLGFGLWWGLKFRWVYLATWPQDAKLNSVFMRMTASHEKPFDACRFMKLNKLEGKMFNYWTEGGCIAFGQEPDPNTGKTPLQLFMDGRAQAAYDRRTYDMWGSIMSGGPVAARLYDNARLRKRKLTSAEYTQIGRWIDKELKRHQVWAVLMPVSRNTKQFLDYMQYTGWQLAFLNRKQRLYVDVKTARGKELFEGILTGKTLYPDEYLENMIKAHTLVLLGKDQNAGKQAFELALKALNQENSQSPVVLLENIGKKFADVRGEVYGALKEYFDDFEKNRKLYANQHGYFHRQANAAKAAMRLRILAKNENNAEQVKFYDEKIREYNREQRALLVTKRW